MYLHAWGHGPFAMEAFLIPNPFHYTPASPRKNTDRTPGLIGLTAIAFNCWFFLQYPSRPGSFLCNPAVQDQMPPAKPAEAFWHFSMIQFYLNQGIHFFLEAECLNPHVLLQFIRSGKRSPGFWQLIFDSS